jgi:hypothetical protein
VTEGKSLMFDGSKAPLRGLNLAERLPLGGCAKRQQRLFDAFVLLSTIGWRLFSAVFSEDSPFCHK